MMKVDCRTNELLLQVAERFMFHSEKAKTDNPLIADMASKMCEIELWEMWVLTQG